MIMCDYILFFFCCSHFLCYQVGSIGNSLYVLACKGYIQPGRRQRTPSGSGQGPCVSLDVPGFLLFCHCFDVVFLWLPINFRVCVSLGSFSWRWRDCKESSSEFRPSFRAEIDQELSQKHVKTPPKHLPEAPPAYPEIAYSQATVIRTYQVSQGCLMILGFPSFSQGLLGFPRVSWAL